MRNRFVYGFAVVIVLLSIFILAFGSSKQAGPRDYYIACGCGCCTDVEPQSQCIFHSNGDSLEELIQTDRAIAASSECPYVGCSIPIKYAYCD